MADFVSSDLAYAAGIIDGEGTIGITEYAPGGKRKSPQFRCYVSVVMTDPSVPLWLAVHFGGTTHSYGPRKVGHKGTTTWRLQNRRAAEFCRLILPFLLVKGHQAEAIVAFYDDPSFQFKQRRSLPEDEVAARRRYVTQVRALNKRGA